MQLNSVIYENKTSHPHIVLITEPSSASINETFEMVLFETYLFIFTRFYQHIQK